MHEINENIRKKLKAYPKQVARICEDTIQVAHELPESAVVSHLDGLIRKAVKLKDTAK